MVGYRVSEFQEVTVRAKKLAQSPPKPPLNCSLVAMNWGKMAQFGGSGADGDQIVAELRFVDIKTASFGYDTMIRLLPELPFEEKAVASKLILPRLAPQDKYFVRMSLWKGSRPRRWRRVRRQWRENPLQLIIDFLVLSMYYSLGIIASRMTVSRARKRLRVKDFCVGGTECKMHGRAVRDKKHTSSVESYLVAFDAGDAFSKYRHRTMSMSYDGDKSEDRQSEEIQSAYKRYNEAEEEVVIGKNLSLGRTEEQNDENDWSWVLQDKDGDALAESISSLHTTQEVLETEIHKLSEISKEFEAEESSSGNRDQDVITSPYSKVDVFEMNDRMEHLEQKLKEASNTIREKDLRLSKLQTLISSPHTPTMEEEATSINQLELELGYHLQEKLQAEIQCLVMLKARQNWQVRTEDQIALEEHKSSAAGNDATKMMLKLRDTERKIIMLKEQVDMLEVHEKDLYRTTEVLKMQSRTFKVSLLGLIQLIMLCLSLKMFFSRVPSAPFSDVVPT